MRVKLSIASNVYPYQAPYRPFYCRSRGGLLLGTTTKDPLTICPMPMTNDSLEDYY